MQGEFAHNSIGGAASPFWINSCAPARSSHCRSLPHLLPAPFSCSFACVLAIDPVSHQSNIISLAKRWLAAQCCPFCYSPVGSTHAGIVCLPIEWFYLVPHQDPLACLNKWRKGKGTCPGPASDRDLLTGFCGCRPMLTRTQNSRDWLCSRRS